MNFDRKTFYRDNNFKVYLEEIGEQVFIHVAIDHFSKTVLGEIKDKWKEVAFRMYCLGYEKLFAYTEDNRIIKLIGGAKKIGQHQDIEVWEWEFN